MKKIPLIIAILLCFSTAWAQDFYEVSNGDTIYYTITNSLNRIVAVERCGRYTSNLTIPSSVTRNGLQYTVTSISAFAFYGRSTITSVTIPNSVTRIGNQAFYQCTGLTSVTIGNSVTRIEVGAFSGCSALTSVTIPNSVTYIGNFVFENCSSLTSVTIPYSVTSIGNNAFYGCTGLTRTNYTGTIAQWCDIDFDDFYENPIYYSHNLYINNQLVTNLVIPNTVDTIKQYTFVGDTSITSVTIPNSVTYIGDYAFSGCSALTSITIPNSVTYIGSHAFYQCSGLTSAIINSRIIGFQAFSGCSGLTSLTMGNSVTGIYEEAFYQCTGLISVTIPNSVTGIGRYVFRNCTGLTSVTIPNSVKRIGDYAFSGDTNLTMVNFNADSCTIMGSAGHPVFAGCNNLQTINIGNNVRIIPDYAFSRCTGLTSVTIPNSVTNIGAGAFERCTGLTSITIPNTGTSIGEYAFENCSSLISVTIPDSVTSIGNYAFAYCHSLTSATISSDSIGEYAFRGCTSLTSVTIGRAVVRIGYRVFAGDSNLTTVYFNADSCIYSGYYRDNNRNYYVFDECGISTLVIGNNVKIIPSRAFCGCTSLASLTIGDSVTSIGYGAFGGCSRLTSVTIPNSVRSIDDYAFSGCSRLTSVTIPNSVTSIGYGAFNNCTGLTSVTMRGSSTAMSSNSFGGVSTNIPVYVPCGALAWYRNQLSGFSNFIERRYEYSLSSHDTVKGTVATVTAPTCNSSSWTICATPNYGYTFSHWSDGDTMNPRNITLTKDTNIIAFFSTIYYNVALSANDTNIGSVSGSGRFAYLSQDTLTATANTGYVFTRWNDGNTQNPRVITVVQDTIFTAYFAVEHNVIVHSNDSTKGSVSGSGRFANLSQDTLTATAETGYTFTRWNDGNKQNPRVITVTQDTIFTAYFAVAHNVVVHSDDSTKGSVSGSGIFGYLTHDTLTVTANTGYVFSQWNDGNTSNPRIITVTQDTAFTAFFNPNYYNVTVLPNDTAMGTVSGSGRFAYLSKDTITATPNTGYIFSRWSDGNNQNTRIITVRQNITVTAIFYLDPNYYNVTVSSNDTAMGTVTGNGRFAYLSQDTITATANTGYTFSRWSDGNTQNPRTLTVTQDTVLIAYFTSNQGIAEAENDNISIRTANGHIVLEGVADEKVYVTDVLGRVVYNATVNERAEIAVRNRGVYFVIIGSRPAQKVVVAR